MTESTPSEPPEPEPSCPEGRPRRGLSFSLRELMLVAVIIVLVFAAATPSYRQRRTLANVARVRADLRALAIALDPYMIDNMAYPACGIAEGPGRSFTVPASGNSPAHTYPVPGGVLTINSSCRPGGGARRMVTFRLPVTTVRTGPTTVWSIPHTLTTPCAYIASYPPDPFADSRRATYGYFSHCGGWIVWSPGPDRDENAPGGPADIGAQVELIYTSAGNYGQTVPALLPFTYDATNGVYSDGDIIRIRE